MMERFRLARNFAAAFKRPRWRWALAFALASDALSFGLEFASLGLAEFPQVLVDLGTAAGLALLVRPRWSMALPLLVEAFPATSVFPSWALAVAAWAALEADPKNEAPHGA
jgi:hypothetical protein